jgi:ferredoxin
MALLSFSEKMRIPSYDNPEHCMMAELSIDQEKCNGCGLCVKACVIDVLHLEGKGKDRKLVVNPNRPTGGRETGRAKGQCVACNACMAICERGAIMGVKGSDYLYRYKHVLRGELEPPRIFKD